MMVNFESSKTAPAPFWPTGIRDGARMECSKESEFYIAVYLNGMTKKEETALRKSKINTRYIQDGGCFLLLVQFSGENLILELPFDPTIYNDRAVSINAMGIVQFLFIDSSSGILRGLRIATPPQKAWRAFADSVALPMATKYDTWLNGLMRKSTDDLWGIAIDGGSFGE